jgi:hypothetical protein
MIHNEKSSTFFQLMNFLNFAFEDFFKDGNIENNILQNKDDKITLMHVLLNIFKIMLIYPKHVKTHNTKDAIKAIRTKMAGRELANQEVNYLKGDYDNSRLSDFTSTDSEMVYIASIDSYYFIYKKFNIKDKNLYIIFEVYDYLETLLNKKAHSDSLTTLFKELMTIMKNICKSNYNIDIDNLFD